MNILEIKGIIGKLNEEIYEQMGEEQLYLEVRSISISMVIEFLGEQLWNEDDDFRGYINEGTPEEDYEPLEGYLRKEVNKLIDSLKKIKL